MDLRISLWGMAGVFLALCMLVTAWSPRLYAEDSPTRDLRVTDATRQATVYLSENPKIAVPLNEETPVAEGDIVQTGPRSGAELTLDGETVFKLQPGTTFKVEKIFVKNTQLSLSQGGMLAKVKPVTDPMQGIIVKLPTAVVAVRGTEFGAETQDSLSHVGVFDEGHVVVAGAWGHEHVKLSPNQETQVPLSNVPQPPRSLLHFRALRSQMHQVRNRAAYWKKNWRPMTLEHRRLLRDRLTGPHRRPRTGFKRLPAKPSARHGPSKRHPAKKVHVHKKIHAAQRPRAARPLHSTPRPQTRKVLER